MRDLLFIHQRPSSEEVLLNLAGLSFREFVQCVDRPLNLLAFRTQYPDLVNFHEIGFHAIRDHKDARFNDLDKLLENPRFMDGDLHWIDYSDEQALLEIGDQELAELCFLSQQGRPLHSPFLKTLENRYVYFGHDDGFVTSLYIDSVNERNRVLGKAIRQKSFSFGFNLMECKSALKRLDEGLLFDFRELSEDGLPVRVIGADFSFDTIDSVYSTFKETSAVIHLPVSPVST